ncbi:MAG TPA: hypothetical protein DCP51_05760 [Clostridiales bacterium]|nr:MAG: hypothetical protein A2Y40_00955 [Candidatus Margulisbacteria bacterium GWF2_35_9]HAN21166.1 hypothetical protein [Clostridiales bacterium]
MFENIYGLSCVENQVLAQIKSSETDISVLYGTSFIGVKELLLSMLSEGIKPEYFSLIPRIHDTLKQLGVISLELVHEDDINKVIENINLPEHKLLVKVKSDFVKNRLFARGLRSDHYILIEKENDCFKLTNDIPETIIVLNKKELEEVYDSSCFILKILRDLTDTDKQHFEIRPEYINDNISFEITEENLESILDPGIKIRNFFWIYKTLLYRQTEFLSAVSEPAAIEEKRDAISNLFAQAEYLNLKKYADCSKYFMLLSEAFKIEDYIKTLAIKFGDKI